MDYDASFWIAHIEALRTSGETQRAYCARHGLAPRSLRAWRARLFGPVHPAGIHDDALGEADDTASPVACPLPAAASSMEVMGGPLQRRRWSDEDKRRLVYEALRSGMGLSRFARLSGLQPSVLFRWRNTFAQFIDARPPASGVQPTFATVQIASTPQVPATAKPSSGPAQADERTGAIEIILTNGHRVRVGRDVDPDALRRILAVLEAPA